MLPSDFLLERFKGFQFVQTLIVRVSSHPRLETNLKPIFQDFSVQKIEFNRFAYQKFL